MATFDDKGKKRVGPGDEKSWRDRLLPERHGKWWNFDTRLGRTKTVKELYSSLAAETIEQAAETLSHVEAIAQTATDRAAAADRRATTIAGTVAIAASFTLSGAGLVLDPGKIGEPFVRTTFAFVLALTTIAFVAAAFYALRALVGTRQWNWSEPYDLPIKPERREKRLGMRAAHLLRDFAANWEISDVKNRNVDIALRYLVTALAGIAVLGTLVAISVSISVF